VRGLSLLIRHKQMVGECESSAIFVNENENDNDRVFKKTIRNINKNDR